MPRARAEQAADRGEESFDTERAVARDQALALEAELGSARDEVASLEASLAAARDDATEAQDRATVARVRLDQLADERDELAAAVAALEQANDEQGRRAADDLARAREVAAEAAARADDQAAGVAAGAADTAGFQEALVAARFEAEALRGETTVLAAQLEEAWAQVEEARRIADGVPSRTRTRPEAGAPPADAGGTVDSVATERTLLDAFAELARGAGRRGAGRSRRPVRGAVPPDPEDPDARRAALGFLNSLATDGPPPGAPPPLTRLTTRR